MAKDHPKLSKQEQRAGHKTRVRELTVKVRLHAKERDDIDILAKARGLDRSEYMRQVALGVVARASFTALITKRQNQLLILAINELRRVAAGASTTIPAPTLTIEALACLEDVIISILSLRGHTKDAREKERDATPTAPADHDAGEGKQEQTAGHAEEGVAHE